MTSDVTLVSTTGQTDLDEQAEDLFSGSWPEFIFHDIGVKPFLRRRAAYFADWDFYALDSQRRLVGAGYGVPLRWDGTLENLPEGYTDALGRSVAEHESEVEPNTLVIMGAMVRTDESGKGWAGLVLQALRTDAVDRGLESVIAPVRPTLKHRYPLTDIETFAAWTRADGLPFDPWVRTHARLGATILRCAPTSQTMTGTVAEWESWTGMALPSSGDYVIPQGLSVLRLNRAEDIGVYHEPNIWMRHV